MVQMTAKTTKTGVPKPTDAELVILRVLWARGASTVREVHDILSAHRSMVYTTTLKLLQIMTAKGPARPSVGSIAISRVWRRTKRNAGWSATCPSVRSAGQPPSS